MGVCVSTGHCQICMRSAEFTGINSQPELPRHTFLYRSTYGCTFLPYSPPCLVIFSTSVTTFAKYPHEQPQPIHISYHTVLRTRLFCFSPLSPITQYPYSGHFVVPSNRELPCSPFRAPMVAVARGMWTPPPKLPPRSTQAVVVFGGGSGVLCSVPCFKICRCPFLHPEVSTLLEYFALLLLWYTLF